MGSKVCRRHEMLSSLFCILFLFVFALSPVLTPMQARRTLPRALVSHTLLAERTSLLCWRMMVAISSARYTETG